MTGGAVVKAAAGGATRRLVQTFVIFCVLAAGAAASLVGVALAASSNELFLGAVARHHAADLAVTLDASQGHHGGPGQDPPPARRDPGRGSLR